MGPTDLPRMEARAAGRRGEAESVDKAPAAAAEPSPLEVSRARGGMTTVLLVLWEMEARVGMDIPAEGVEEEDITEAEAVAAAPIVAVLMPGAEEEDQATLPAQTHHIPRDSNQEMDQ